MRSLSRFIGALGTGALLLSAFPAVAQTADSLNQSGSSDVDSTFGGNDGLSMFELMHRAQQGQIRSPYEFSHDQQESLSEAAADFRTRQQEAYQQQQSPNTNQFTETDPAPTPQPQGNQF